MIDKIKLSEKLSMFKCFLNMGHIPEVVDNGAFRPEPKCSQCPNFYTCRKHIDELLTEFIEENRDKPQFTRLYQYKQHKDFKERG